jgi:hypothetical protein
MAYCCEGKAVEAAGKTLQQLFVARRHIQAHDMTAHFRRKPLRRKGKPVGYFLFSGEQHGFRNAANIQRCLDAELQFYAIEVFKIGLTF